MPDLRARLAERFDTIREALSSRSSARSWLWRKLGPPQGCFHISNHTEADRFPAVFEEIADRIGPLADCRVLSFGCSTGAEVFSLHGYLPRAEIVGIDINSSSIVQAKRAWLSSGADPRISFRCAANCADEPLHSFDAILAMMVFCSGRLLSRPETCTDLLPFAAFDDEIGRFAERLKPGGLLVIAHANFRVDDTSHAGRFELVRQLDEGEARGVLRPVYGPDERLIEGASDPGAIYCRVG